MDILETVVEKIIEEQEIIIGPIALEQAKKVNGLNIDWQKHKISIQGDKTKILGDLVDQYKLLFGQTSVEVCRETINRYKTQLSPDQLPQTLR